MVVVCHTVRHFDSGVPGTYHDVRLGRVGDVLYFRATTIDNGRVTWFPPPQEASQLRTCSAFSNRRRA